MQLGPRSLILTLLLPCAALAWEMRVLEEGERHIVFEFQRVSDQRQTGNALFAIPHATHELILDTMVVPTGVVVNDATTLATMHNGTSVQVFDVRDLRLVNITVPHGIFLDSERHELERLRYRLVFDGPREPGVTPLPPPEDDPFDPIWQGLLDNHAISRGFRGVPPAEPFDSPYERARREMRARGDRPLIVETGAPGLYRVTVDDLRDVGAPPDTIAPDSLAVWYRGEPVRAWVTGPADRLGPDSAVLFYVDGEGTPETPRRAYWITWGDGPGLRMSDPAWEDPGLEAPATPATPRGRASLGRTQRYLDDVSQLRGQDGWVEGSLGTPHGTFYGCDLELPGLVPSGTATVTFDLIQTQGAPTLMRYRVNGPIVHYATLEQRSLLLNESFDIPAGRLNPGSNRLMIQFDDVDAHYAKTSVAVMRVTVDYPKAPVLVDAPVWLAPPSDAAPNAVYRVDNPGGERPEILQVTPSIARWTELWREEGQALEGPLPNRSDALVVIAHPNQAHPPTAMRRAEMLLPDAVLEADYLVVSPRRFVDALQPLLSWRRQQGLRVAVWEAEQVWDDFGHGMMEPEALRRALLHAMRLAVPPMPSYVLLIGDSNWDTWDRFQLDYPVVMPSYSTSFRESIPSDIWFVSQEGNISLPWAAIGRLSVSQPDELSQVVDKLLRFEQEARPGPWLARSMIALDTNINVDRPSPYREPPPQLTTTHISPQTFDGSTMAEGFWRGRDLRQYTDYTQHLIDGLDQGSLVLEYYGHGGVGNWSPHRLFLAMNRPDSDVRRLRPNNRLPVVLNWSCLTARHSQPPPFFERCMAEEFVLWPHAGAVAFWGDAGYGHTSSHLVLSRAFAEGLWWRNLDEVGLATAYSILNASLKRHTGSTARRMNLIGDPATRLLLPRESLSIITRPKLLDGARPALGVVLRWANAPHAATMELCLLGEDGLEHGLTTPDKTGPTTWSTTLELTPPLDRQTVRVAAVGWDERHDRLAGGTLEVACAVPDATIELAALHVDGEEIVLRLDAGERRDELRWTAAVPGRAPMRGSLASLNPRLPTPTDGVLDLTLTLHEAAPPLGWGRLVHTARDLRGVPPIAQPDAPHWTLAVVPEQRPGWDRFALPRDEPALLRATLHGLDRLPSTTVEAWLKADSHAVRAPIVLGDATAITLELPLSDVDKSPLVHAAVAIHGRVAQATWQLPVVTPARLEIEALTTRPTRPVRDDSIWFDATVANRGGLPSRGAARVELVSGADGELLEGMRSKGVTPEMDRPVLPVLLPNATAAVSLRWDAFDLVGDVTGHARISGPDAGDHKPFALHIDETLGDVVRDARDALGEGELERANERFQEAMRRLRARFPDARDVPRTVHPAVSAAALEAGLYARAYDWVAALGRASRQGYPHEQSVAYLADTADVLQGLRPSVEQARRYHDMRADDAYKMHRPWTDPLLQAVAKQAKDDEGRDRALAIYRFGLERFPLNHAMWAGLIETATLAEDTDLVIDTLVTQVERLGHAFPVWSGWLDSPRWHVYEREGLTPASVDGMSRLARSLPWAHTLPLGAALGRLVLGDNDQAEALLASAPEQASHWWRAEQLALQGLLDVLRGDSESARDRLRQALALDPKLLQRKVGHQPAEWYGDDLAKLDNAPSLRFSVSAVAASRAALTGPLSFQALAKTPTPWRAPLPAWYLLEFETAVRIEQVDVLAHQRWNLACAVEAPTPGDPPGTTPLWRVEQWGTTAERFTLTTPHYPTQQVKMMLTRTAPGPGHGELLELRVFPALP